MMLFNNLHTLLLLVVVISVVILLIQMRVLENYESSSISSSSFIGGKFYFKEQRRQEEEEQQQRREQEVNTTTTTNNNNNNNDGDGDGEKEDGIDDDDDDDDELKPILNILRQGGYDISKKNKLINRSLLPKWSDILKAYGPPKILGLETCSKYQNHVKPTKRNIAPAGLFNSGTNLLHYLLFDNCDWSNQNITHSVGGRPAAAAGTGLYSKTPFQVPWGKHIPAVSRTNHTHSHRPPPYHTTMPVVSIRDPYTWMQSMCRQNYAAQFDHNKSECPNIIPYPRDMESYPRYKKMKYLPVNVKYNKDYAIHYDSLPHLWNEWYEHYVEFNDDKDKNTGVATKKEQAFPFLVVRMEDLVFHAQTVVPQLCECVGATFQGSGEKPEIKHHANVANTNHGIDVSEGSDTGLLRSIIKYGNFTNRREGYPKFQLEAAKQLLDSRLMNLMGYRYEEP